MKICVEAVFQCDLVSGADTGGVQGMHPPTRPKEVLT